MSDHQHHFAAKCGAVYRTVVLAEHYDALTQRCRELESKCNSLHEDNRHLHQVNLDWAERYIKLERDINDLQSENKQLKTLLNQKELPCT